MPAVFHSLILITYLSICYQDFKAREVYIYTFLVLYVLFFLYWRTDRTFLNIDFIIINSCILIAATCLLLVYYLVKYKLKSLSRLKASVGWGDVFMIPAFIVSFSSSNLLVVFIFSLIISLGYHLIGSFRSGYRNTIPLAGIQSLILALFMSAEFFGFMKLKIDFFTLL